MPDIFKVDDIDRNVTSKWVYTKENVAPHSSAYKELEKINTKD